MFFATLTEVGATPALEKTLSFNQARLRMIAENVANINTPGYRAKQLDVRAFQGALREAMDARGGDPSRPFVVNAGSEVKTDRFGRGEPAGDGSRVLHDRERGPPRRRLAGL